jgi:L-Lysine epsilon oxidase N-terminal/L-lysine epsilon oxidase C-terminal domain/von Willebrand factor type A domain
MATVYKIHPAIGIARVGNSPDDFFIGPERIGERPNPPDGFKDAQCRVKRQAARFRIFAHHGDGTVEEVTKAKAKITWTVHLANKKAAFPGRGNSGAASDLTIDPGARSLNGPNQRQLFDTGTIKFSNVVTTVPLGEIRSDTDNHLLVLGGFGHSASPLNSGLGDFWQNTDWFDDVSDGPVTATIKLNSDNSTPAVTGAWVIVAPPKFAPHQDSVMTLYDRVFQVMVKAGLKTAPATTSYTNDIYPILQRAEDIRWVINISPASAMTWVHPVTSDSLRNTIFNSLKKPGGGGDDMPQLNPPDTGDPIDFQTDRLTDEQYAHMQRWKDNTYTNDWVGPPAPEPSVSPDGLDRAALEACVGGSFYPGIEAGGLPPSASANYPGLAAESRPIATATNYAEAFRLDHGVVSAGDISSAMALPWQADFRDCADNWWPVPRPDEVIRNGVANQGWIDGVVGSLDDMVQKWSQLGFVVRQGNQYVEAERCDTASITLLTPLLNFQDVPQGPMGMPREAALAITFEVISPSSAVTLEYAPGGAPSNPQLTAFNASVTVGPTPANGIATARLWVIYRTSNVGDVLPPQTIMVQDSSGTQSWVVTIIGNTVARKTSAVALVMDRSGSMSEDVGDGQSKHTSLQQAASIFVDVMLEGDGVGLVRFNQAAEVLQTVLQLGDGSLSDVNRGATRDIINGNGLDPFGETSIGDGILKGRGILDSAPTPFDVDSLVVLTDGVENSPPMIADVADQINEYTYAIGLGQPQNISVPALQTISGNNGGYLLITGSITTDNRFLLQKYFLQILAGVSNAEIVLDPNGQLILGRVERVPFQLTSADAGVDVVLLTPYAHIVDFRLQTPGGRIIEPWRAMSEPGMRFVLSNGVSYYRLALPAQLLPNRFDGPGTWYALLTIGRPRLKRGDRANGSDSSILHGMFAPPTRASSRPANRALALRASILAAEQFAANVGTEFAIQSVDAATTNRTLPYSLVVHAYSNVSLQAHVEQSSFEPGAKINFYASLAQSGIPLSHRCHVWAEVTRPDGSTTVLALHEHAEGQFSANFTTTTPGVYRFRIRARGTTQRGEPFSREKTLTAAVWRGGDGNPGNGGTGSHGPTCVCALIKCLLERDGLISPEIEKRLKALGIDIDAVRKCLEIICDGKHDYKKQG